jgi:hypothetical protein
MLVPAGASAGPYDTLLLLADPPGPRRPSDTRGEVRMPLTSEPVRSLGVPVESGGNTSETGTGGNAETFVALEP